MVKVEGLTIKRASLIDFNDFKNLQKEGYGYVAMGLESYISLKLFKRTKEYLIYSGDKKVGFLQVGKRGVNKRHVYNICFLKNFQKLGLGTKALEYVKELNKEDGVEVITLHVRSKNTGVVDWYRRNGFEKINVLPNYYGDDDGFYMRYSSVKR